MTSIAAQRRPVRLDNIGTLAATPNAAAALPDTWDQIASLRLERQRLAQPAPASAMLVRIKDPLEAGLELGKLCRRRRGH